MNKKRVIVVHGWEATPSDHWFSWLARELEKDGFERTVPEMPNTDHPILREWLSKLRTVIGAPDENTYCIGHSVGAIAVMRYLEALEGDRAIGGAVFVAGFPESIGYEELNSFFESPLDYVAVRKHAGRFIAIQSDTDPYVPLKNGELLRDNLGAELRVIKNGGHFNAEDGYTEFPILLDALHRLMRVNG